MEGRILKVGRKNIEGWKKGRMLCRKEGRILKEGRKEGRKDGRKEGRNDIERRKEGRKNIKGWMEGRILKERRKDI
jgi:hypothetical protein